MADDTKRGGGGFSKLLAGLVILALAAAVVWLLVERNLRTWYLVPDEGRLVVMHGTALPFGRETYVPSDPALAEAYAPVVPPQGATLPPEQIFDERAALDQALFGVLAGWARGDVASGVRERLARGLEYLRRAEKLPGLSASQQQELAALRAESGFFEAQGMLERAAQDLSTAAERLRAAAGSRSAHAGDARLLLREVEPALDAVLGALRQGPRRAPQAQPPQADPGLQLESGAPPPAEGTPSPSPAP